MNSKMFLFNVPLHVIGGEINFSSALQIWKDLLKENEPYFDEELQSTAYEGYTRVANSTGTPREYPAFVVTGVVADELKPKLKNLFSTFIEKAHFEYSTASLTYVAIEGRTGF